MHCINVYHNKNNPKIYEKINNIWNGHVIVQYTFYISEINDKAIRQITIVCNRSKNIYITECFSNNHN